MPKPRVRRKISSPRSCIDLKRYLAVLLRLASRSDGQAGYYAHAACLSLRWGRCVTPSEAAFYPLLELVSV